MNSSPMFRTLRETSFGPRTMRRAALRTLLVSSLAVATGGALASPFADADLDEGRRHHETLCIACHAERFGGEDGSNIYTRADRRVHSPSALEQQLTACTTMLNLDLFPEDEYHIAGYLNQRFYQFD